MRLRLHCALFGLVYPYPATQTFCDNRYNYIHNCDYRHWCSFFLIGCDRFCRLALSCKKAHLSCISLALSGWSILIWQRKRPPSRPPQGGSPAPRLWAFLLGSPLIAASRGPPRAASCKQSAPSKKARSRFPPQNRSNIFYLLPLSKKFTS